MNTQHTTQTYTHKTGQAVTYEYDYPVYSGDDVIKELEDGSELGKRMLKDLNRQAKTDPSNVARADAVAKAGLAPERAPVSEEQKAANKEFNKVVREVTKAAKAKGYSPDQIRDVIANL